jgi:hypothetical protein
LLFVTLVAIGPLVRRHTRTRALAQALPHTP